MGNERKRTLIKWIPTTNIPWLEAYIPDWLGLWFSIFPTVETLAAQGLAAAIVIGSFFLAKKQSSSETAAVPTPASAVN